MKHIKAREYKNFEELYKDIKKEYKKENSLFKKLMKYLGGKLW